MILSGEFIENCLQSLFKYISGTTYTARGSTGILQTFYPAITYGVGYPDDLEKLVIPHIAIQEPDFTTPVDMTIGGQIWQEVNIPFTIYGFAGTQPTNPGLCRRERMRMASDIYGICNNFESGIAYFPVYDFASNNKGTQDGSAEITDVRIINVDGQTGVVTDKYKFICDLNVRVLV